MSEPSDSQRGYGDDPILDSLSDEDVLRLWRNGDLRTADLGLIPVGMKESWRSVAAARLSRLDFADGIEAKGLHELCMALRSGLTPEQQRAVAMDLLAKGEEPGT